MKLMLYKAYHLKYITCKIIKNTEKRANNEGFTSESSVI